MTKTIFEFNYIIDSNEPAFDPAFEDKHHLIQCVDSGTILLSDEETWTEESNYVTVENASGGLLKVNKNFLVKKEGLNRADIVEAVIQFDTVDIIVMYDAALVIHKLKELSPSIDSYLLGVGPLNNTEIGIYAKKGDPAVRGVFDFGKEGRVLPPIEFDRVGAIKVQTLESIVKHKEHFAREKEAIVASLQADVESIEEIKQYIAKRGNENE